MTPAQREQLSDRQWLVLTVLSSGLLNTPKELARGCAVMSREWFPNVKAEPPSRASLGRTVGSLIARGYAKRLYGPRGIRYGITMEGVRAVHEHEGKAGHA